MKRTLSVSLPIFLILILACNLPAATTETAAESTLTVTPQDATATQDDSGEGTSTPTATSTQPSAPTNTPVTTPCNAASFVTDVSIPDDTMIGLDKPFTKTWRLKNVGSCSWTSGYQLVFDSGDKMGGPASQQLTNSAVDPGGTIDVSVDLKAPSTPGTYKGNWKLREPGGETFGLSTGPFWVPIHAIVQFSVADWPLKKQGDQGPEVYALQQLLRAHGENLNADGKFGPITKSRVQHFQSQNGLNADGVVGPKTWPKLIIQVKQGNHSPAVRAVQWLLNKKFGYSLSVDGIFGPDTASAVKDFQGDHFLTVDGIVGPGTWKGLITG